MESCDLSRESLLNPRAGNLEWRSRVHFDAAYCLALAGDRPWFQTLTVEL
jgi:hypothetical protein